LCGTARQAATGRSSVSVKQSRAMLLPSVMLSGAPRLHGQAYRISSAQSKHPEKVSVYIPHQGIFPMPPPAKTGWGCAQPIPALHSRIMCNDRREWKSRADVAGHTLGRIPYGYISSAGFVGMFRLRAHPSRGYRFSPGAPLNMTVRRRFGRYLKIVAREKEFRT